MGDVISLELRRDAERLKEIRARLPEPDALRWIPRRKAQVLSAIDCGALSYDEARERYALSREEVDSWREMLIGGDADMSSTA